jgi:hypothetical protein
MFTGDVAVPAYQSPQITQIEIGWKYYIPMTRYREKLWRCVNCAILLPLPGPEASAGQHESAT